MSDLTGGCAVISGPNTSCYPPSLPFHRMSCQRLRRFSRRRFDLLTFLNISRSLRLLSYVQSCRLPHPRGSRGARHRSTYRLRADLRTRLRLNYPSSCGLANLSSLLRLPPDFECCSLSSSFGNSWRGSTAEAIADLSSRWKGPHW